ncbi:hypothetical protein HMPREF3190_01361 [Umbribacter vaginalis]|nr:hypothetical protein HMPREF3190_01361 [Coriobacteriales bacterium DNF00809]
MSYMCVGAGGLLARYSVCRYRCLLCNVSRAAVGCTLMQPEGCCCR